MQLQKSPIGLLGAFALKVLGRNPQQFGDQVVPVVDVYDQYLAIGELQILTGSGLATALAAFNSVSFTVPNGKAWRLKAASLIGSLNAADAAVVSVQTIALQSPNSAPFSVRLATRQDPANAGVRHVAWQSGTPIFLPSGWKVTFELWTVTAITVTSTLLTSALIQEIET
jgi:putative lipoic acid-binding regulatory protein